MFECENICLPPAFVSADDGGVILLLETIIISRAAAFTFQRCHEKCTESCAKLSAEKLRLNRISITVLSQENFITFSWEENINIQWLKV